MNFFNKVTSKVCPKLLSNFVEIFRNLNNNFFKFLRIHVLQKTFLINIFLNFKIEISVYLVVILFSYTTIWIINQIAIADDGWVPPTSHLKWLCFFLRLTTNRDICALDKQNFSETYKSIKKKSKKICNIKANIQRESKNYENSGKLYNNKAKHITSLTKPKAKPLCGHRKKLQPQFVNTEKKYPRTHTQIWHWGCCWCCRLKVSECSAAWNLVSCNFLAVHKWQMCSANCCLSQTSLVFFMDFNLACDFIVLLIINFGIEAWLQCFNQLISGA